MIYADRPGFDNCADSLYKLIDVSFKYMNKTKTDISWRTEIRIKNKIKNIGYDSNPNWVSAV